MTHSSANQITVYLQHPPPPSWFCSFNLTPGCGRPPVWAPDSLFGNFLAATQINKLYFPEQTNESSIVKLILDVLFKMNFACQIYFYHLIHNLGKLLF